jgi:putative glutamine amidotransferase
VLAICFGIQSLNVFMGGTLIQDIPSRVQSGILHSQPDAGYAHAVDIEAGSLLEQLAGSQTAMVNSTHHQALERVGEGLDVIARAPDGIVEAVSGAGGEQWVLGVQWHPEKSYDYDEFSRKIFGAFLAQCCTP